MNVEEEFKKALEEEASVTFAAYQEAFASYGAPVQNTHGDQQFMAAFLAMLNAYGPDWVTAKEFVPGGKED